MFAKLGVLFGAVGLALAPAAASAATYLATFTGKVMEGFDGAGLFGPVNASLNNAPYTLVYTLTYPYGSSAEYDDGVKHVLSGFYGNGAVSAALQINGITQSLAGSYEGTVIFSNALGLVVSDPYDSVDFYVEDHSGPFGLGGAQSDGKFLVQSHLYSYVNNFLSSVNFAEPVDYTFSLGDNSDSRFYFAGTRFSFGYLDINRVTFGMPGAFPDTGVPEPSSWCLLILGFGGIGAGLRHRRRPKALGLHRG